jgi:hypothetical protein
MSVLDRPVAPPAATGPPAPSPGPGAGAGRDAGPRPRPPRRRPPRRWLPRLDRFAAGVAAAVVVAFALRLAIGLTDDAPASDETAYLDSGAALVAGEGFERGDRPELHFPPLVPFVLGVAARVTGDPHAGSVAVTVLAGTAAVVPLALIGRRVAGPALGPRAGVAVAWVAALAPGLATLPATRGTGSEATYTLVVAVAVALVLAARDGTPTLRRGPTAAAGLAIGLAYLARPEGLFLAVPLGLAVAWPGRRPPAEGGGRAWRDAARAAATFALPIGLCVVPYAAFLHHHTGAWELTAKTQDASLEAWDAVARGDRPARDRILYALDDSGVRFAAGRAPLDALVRDDPAGYAAIVGTNVRTLATTAAGWSLVPLPVTALAAWAVAQRWRTTGRSSVALLVAVGALPVASAVAFFVQPRYLVATVAVVVVLAGVGLASLGGRRASVLTAAVLALLAVTSLTSFRGPEGWGRPTDFTDQRRAGEWLASHAGPDDVVVTRSMVVDFYAERPTLALPDGTLDEVLRFARHYGARWLVADEAHVGKFRPQLATLLTADDVAGLRLVHEVTAEGRTSRVYALDPVPPPAPPGRAGPALGFMGDGA